ncbi:hypothetical protein LEP1GSC060_1076 [Leptospira weilii serovar Ranarum str. ICFT]|uniref:Uncharacterized protein n=1 Tax=Leptospira weilii serovar Ranarum str. ICFT TaxID=1218598 RepID=N1WJJ0_9LEPT|nr:hypothetical protein [Leptospira weilii]EMY79115.1 hypothetical protein LEP1GSC060_1076 [Leptospira weilii serovar Ranarum str. ICFT]
MDKMETIRKWSGGLFLFGIAFNLLCASWMNLSGICPIGMPNLIGAVSADSIPPCHKESSNSTSSDSSAPCCSSDVVKADSSIEFRFETQNFFSTHTILVLFLLPPDSILNLRGQNIDSARRQSVSLSDRKNPISLLQVFLI